jgi:hypothetical protein
MVFNDIDKFKYGKVAKALFNQEDPSISRASLEQLASDMGISDSAKGFIQGTYEGGPRSIATAAQTYADQYEEAFGEGTGTDLLNHYTTNIDSYLPNTEATKVKSEFGKYSSRTFKNIKEEFDKNKYISEDKFGNFTDNEKENAKDKMKELAPILSYIEMLEQIKVTDLASGPQKSALKDQFKAIVGQF